MYKLAINRPIATLMYVFTLVIFGWLSFKSMPSSLFPNEEAISRIGGVDSITSTSSEGASVVMVKFFLERNIDEATNDVRDKVAAVELPKNAKMPLVSKLDIGGAPVVNVFLTAQNDTLQNLMLFADEKAKPALQKINGVGAINIIGYRDRELKIFPDIEKLNKFGITVRELNEMVKQETLWVRSP